MKTEPLLQGLTNSLGNAVGTGKALAVTATFTLLTYTAMTLLSFPEFSYQVLSSDIAGIGYAISSLTVNSYQSTGALGLGLTAVYSATVGVTAANLSRTGINVKGLGAGLPLVASGCAGCGAGLLGVLGFIGGIALLPFQGNGLKIAGILLLGYFLAETGNELCEL